MDKQDQILSMPIYMLTVCRFAQINSIMNYFTVFFIYFIFFFGCCCFFIRKVEKLKQISLTVEFTVMYINRGISQMFTKYNESMLIHVKK